MSNSNQGPLPGRGAIPPGGDRGAGPRGPGGGVRPSRTEADERSGSPPPQGRPDHGSGGWQDRERQPLARVADVWPSYLKDGYFDADGNLRPEYVSRSNIELLVREMANDPERPLTMNQLRRFFLHCRGIAARLRTGRANWAQVVPKVLLMDAAAQEAYGRKPERRVPRLFLDFIRSNVAAVKSEKDFLEGFMPHFEAFVGFGARYFPREGTTHYEESRTSYHSRFHRTEKRDADRRQ